MKTANPTLDEEAIEDVLIKYIRTTVSLFQEKMFRGGRSFLSVILGRRKAKDEKGHRPTKAVSFSKSD